MSESKHTPGPWKIDPEWPPTKAHPDWRAIVSYYDDGCHRMSVSGHIGEANAHLIAAAPDLLSALEDSLYVGADEVLKVIIRKTAREAIAKAKGEQP
jgi:hypothetical protein